MLRYIWHHHNIGPLTSGSLQQMNYALTLLFQNLSTYCTKLVLLPILATSSG